MPSRSMCQMPSVSRTLATLDHLAAKLLGNGEEGHVCGRGNDDGRSRRGEVLSMVMRRPESTSQQQHSCGIGRPIETGEPLGRRAQNLLSLMRGKIAEGSTIRLVDEVIAQLTVIPKSISATHIPIVPGYADHLRDPSAVSWSIVRISKSNAMPPAYLPTGERGPRWSSRRWAEPFIA